MPATEHFNGTALQLGGMSIFADSRPGAELDGIMHPAELQECDDNGHSLLWHFTGSGLVWQWRWHIANGRLTVHNTLGNRGDRPLQLGKIQCCSVTTSCLAGRPDIVAMPISYGENCRRQFFVAMQCAGAPDAVRESTVKLDLFDRQKSLALQIGFLSFQRALTYVHYTSDAGSPVAGLCAGMDFGGWELAPGATTPGETFTVACGADPFALLEAWADLAAQTIQPRFRHTPALGWLGGAWDENQAATTETMKLEQAGLLSQKLAGFGFEFVWVSISNLPGGHPGNWLDWNTTHFPGGLDHLVKELGRLGLKLGLWFAPFMLSDHLTELVATLDNAILRDPSGNRLVYYPVWSHGDAGRLPLAQRPRCYALDPSHPKTQDFLQRSLQRYVAAGVRYFMVDFLEAGSGRMQRFPYAAHHDRHLVPGPEVFTAGMRTVRDATGPDTFLLASTGPFLYDAGLVDAVRVGNDFGEGRAIMPDSGFYPASFVVNGSFTAADIALRCAATNYYTHDRLYQNDSGNVLSVDAPIPLESARIHATIHGLSGSSTMLGDDLRHISAERLALIKKTLPRDPVVARPLDLFSAAPDTPRLYHRHVELPGGAYEVVAIYNMTPHARRECVDFTRLGLAPDTLCHAWEFWNEAYLGPAQGSLAVEIPAESVRVFRLTPAADIPQVIGTDMHLLMGATEITACAWNPATNSLTLTVHRPAGESGSIFLHMGQSWHLLQREHGHVARHRDGRHGELLIRLCLQFSQPTLTHTLRFGRHAASADDSRH